MPTCPYCRKTPYLTYCPSYYDHIESCRLSREGGESAKSAQAPVTNIYIGTINVQVNNLYLDYPKNGATQGVLDEARSCDVLRIKTVEDLNQIMGFVQDMHDKQIEKCLTGGDRRVQSQALSFLADVSRTLRERIQKVAPERTQLIGAAEDFEKECLDDKRKLGPIVSDVD